MEGRFARGDLVEVTTAEGPIARGLSGYDTAELSRLMGLRNDSHGAVLGYAPRSAVIHRDQMVLL